MSLHDFLTLVVTAALIVLAAAVYSPFAESLSPVSPEPGAIPWLLLRATSHEGSGQLSTVAFIWRANTKGGAAPAAGCDASHFPEQARMRYSAEYQFFNIAKSTTDAQRADVRALGSVTEA